jgi:hypothetical protein
MIVNSPPDPKRAVLKSVLKRRELRAARRLAPEWVAPLVIQTPVGKRGQVVGQNAIVMNPKNTPTVMLKRPNV